MHRAMVLKTYVPLVLLASTSLGLALIAVQVVEVDTFQGGEQQAAHLVQQVDTNQAVRNVLLVPLANIVGQHTVTVATVRQGVPVARVLVDVEPVLLEHTPIRPCSASLAQLVNTPGAVLGHVQLHPLGSTPPLKVLLITRVLLVNIRMLVPLAVLGAPSADIRRAQLNLLAKRALLESTNLTATVRMEGINVIHVVKEVIPMQERARARHVLRGIIVRHHIKELTLVPGVRIHKPKPLPALSVPQGSTSLKLLKRAVSTAELVMHDRRVVPAHAFLVRRDITLIQPVQSSV